MNRVYKLTPVSMYDVGKLEQWLEQMAAKGLFLKKYGPLLCRFVREEPKRVRYRLEPYRITLSSGFPDDMADLFGEYGWKHVGTISGEMLIFSSADPSAPEPHTDLDIHLEQWKKLYRSARKDFLLITLFSLVCLAFSAYFLFYNGTPLANLLITNIIGLQTLLFLVIRPIFDSAAYYSRVRELAAVIRELKGTPKKHRLWFPSRQFFAWMSWVVLALVVAFMVVALRSISPETRARARPIADFTPLTLDALETGEPVEDREYYGTPQWSLLSWHQWQVWDFEDGDVLNIQWFDLPDCLSFLAVPSAKDLMKDAMKLDDLLWESKEPAGWATREYSEAGANWLSVARTEDGVFQTATAALGDKVVRIRYCGSGELAGHLDEIVDMIR